MGGNIKKKLLQFAWQVENCVHFFANLKKL